MKPGYKPRKTIKVVTNDRLVIYLPIEFVKYCEEKGIIHQVSAAYTPQHKGVVERKIELYQRR